VNGTHQLLVYGNDIHLHGKNTNTLNNNMETVSDASKKVGSEIDAERN
jgi:hypothetical protein